MFQRPGLPVEITAEFEIWRRVRDSEGAEGWVLHSLLSGRRTALVAPGKKGQTYKMFTRPTAIAEIAATLQSGVIVNVRSCDGAWCLVDGEGFKGYIEQVALWGVYPNEKIGLRSRAIAWTSSTTTISAIARGNCGCIPSSACAGWRCSDKRRRC